MSREVCGICWCPYDEETGACGCEPASKEHDMTTLRTAAQQALEALETVFMPFHPAVIDLKAALAEHDKNLAWFKERKANWDLQRKLAEETQERDRLRQEEALQRLTDVSQEIEAAMQEPVQENKDA